MQWYSFCALNPNKRTPEALRSGMFLGAWTILPSLFCGAMVLMSAAVWGNPPESSKGFSTEIPVSQQFSSLQPLPDRRPGNGNHPPLQGRAQKSMEQPAEGHTGLMSGTTGTRILNGRVQTLQQAARTEKDQVDWYAWYLNARDYLFRTGGLDCRAGTLIRFYKSGEIRAMTSDENCITSIGDRRFPLPEGTRLQALVLPVRPTELPPASPEDINTRVKISF